MPTLVAVVLEERRAQLELVCTEILDAFYGPALEAWMENAAVGKPNVVYVIAVSNALEWKEAIMQLLLDEVQNLVMFLHENENREDLAV